MHDFGQFCYLDVQKTGSSFIVKFLRKHSSLKEIHKQAHARVNKNSHVRDGKLFFISARDPLEQYKSLYFFGVRNKGALRKILVKQNPDYASFYDGTPAGFTAWLEFVLRPESYVHLGQGFTEAEAALYGVMTYRFLALSFFRPGQVLRELTERDRLVEHYQAHRLHSAVIKNESLNEDLAQLVAGDLGQYMKSPDKAIADLRATGKKVNVSPRDSAGEIAVSDEMLARLRAREWFLFDVLGYR